MRNLFVSIFVGLTYLLSAQTSQIVAEDVYNSCVKAGKIACWQKNQIVVGKVPSTALVPQAQFLKVTFSSAGTFQLLTDGHTGNYTLYGPFENLDNLLSKCELISLGLAAAISSSYNGSAFIDHSAGSYILKIEFNEYLTNSNYGEYTSYGLSSRVVADCDSNDEVDCKDCLKTFSPTPGEYIVSVWTKGEVANRNKSYLNPFVAIGFDGGALTQHLASGTIIDDWQRIDFIVTVPQEAVTMQIQLGCKSGNCLFDDFRFYPIDGSMISYAYDPITLRLSAQLDERNYATFYEYDEEGQLIRVKKETERGIMTIQENTINLTK